MEIIQKEFVHLDMKGREKDAIIRELTGLITERLSDEEAFVGSVFEREALSTTGIGFGIAIPHGKSPAVKSSTIAFGRVTEPVDWQSLDGNPVEMIFLLAVPEEKQGTDHLRILSNLSRKLIHEDFRKKLKNTTNPDEIVNIITDSIE